MIGLAIDIDQDRHCSVRVLVRMFLIVVVASWVFEVYPFVASALSAEPLLEVVVEPGTPGIDENAEDYDPWEPLNEKIFMLNCAADRYASSGTNQSCLAAAIGRLWMTQAIRS